MGLRVLLTNYVLSGRSGSELYLCEIAEALLERGHTPIAYSPVLGPLANELRARTIPVVSNLALVSEPPDIIHGHQNIEMLTALLYFPGVPGVRLCHGWEDARPHDFPRIRRFVCVDHTVRDRVVSEWGVLPELVEVLLNFVDLRRFQQRDPLPPRPARALVFSNNARHVAAVRAACAKSAIEVDIAGLTAGAVAAEPWHLLRNYDLVFAKARCAIEAMAVGTAVILCDEAGAGTLVTTRNYEGLRRLNFGRRALREPVAASTLVREILQYDAADAAAVCQRIRAEAGLDAAVDALLQIYEEVIAEQQAVPNADAAAELRSAAAYLQLLRPLEPSYGALRHHTQGVMRELFFRWERTPGLRVLAPSRKAAVRINQWLHKPTG